MPALALKSSDFLSGPVSTPVRRELGLSATASWRELASGMAPSTHEAGLLSPAEQVVLAQLRQGLSNREIATALGKSERTVKNQVSAILTKYGVPTRARLIAHLR